MSRQSRKRSAPGLKDYYRAPVISDVVGMSILHPGSLISPNQEKRINEFLERCKMRVCDPAYPLIEQHTTTPYLYILLWGRVRIDRITPQLTAEDKTMQRAVPLAFSLRGDIIGEMLLLGEERHSAQVTAMEKCGIIDLNPNLDPAYTDFINFADSKYYNVWRRVAHNLADKLRRNGINQTMLYEQTIPVRMAKALLQLLDQYPHQDQPDKINMRLDTATLSQHISAAKDSVTDVLKDLRTARNGRTPIIAIEEDDYIVVLDRDALEQASLPRSRSGNKQRK
jgi:CRP-like cAMP-binding protein